MTFREIQDDIFERVREVQGSGVFFSARDIANAANAGYMELSDAAEWFEEYLEVDLLKDRPYYDLFTIVGCGFLSIKPAFHEESNRWLFPSTVRGLDDHDRRWERVVGTPQRIFTRGLRWLGLWPRTNAETGLVKLYYTRLPEPLCADDDEPGFPEAFHRGITDFALADLFAEDGETQHALAAWKDYLEMETGLMAWVQGRERRPLMRVFGAATGPR